MYQKPDTLGHFYRTFCYLSNMFFLLMGFFYLFFKTKILDYEYAVLFRNDDSKTTV